MTPVDSHPVAPHKHRVITGRALPRETHICPAFPLRVVAGNDEPKRRRAAAGEGRHFAEAARSGAEKAERARIAVCDDDPDIRTLLRMWLELRNYDVVELEDGEAALGMLESETPDLLVLDLRLPGMSGNEVLERIRANDRTRALPVVVISAHIGDREAQDCIEAGADAALPKPFSADVLVDEIERVLSER